MRADLATHKPMLVERINGRIEPPLNQEWDNLAKLRWHAGVVLVDSGVSASIVTGCYSERVFGRWRTRPDIYGVTIGSSSHVGFDFDGAWDFLNGVDAGARAVRGRP